MPSAGGSLNGFSPATISFASHVAASTVTSMESCPELKVPTSLPTTPGFSRVPGSGSGAGGSGSALGDAFGSFDVGAAEVDSATVDSAVLASAPSSTGLMVVSMPAQPGRTPNAIAAATAAQRALRIAVLLSVG